MRWYPKREMSEMEQQAYSNLLLLQVGIYYQLMLHGYHPQISRERAIGAILRSFDSVPMVFNTMVN